MQCEWLRLEKETAWEKYLTAHLSLRTLKAIAKKAISRDYWEFLSWYQKRFGFASAISAHADMRLKGVGQAPNPLTRGSVFLRAGTTDQDVYDEILISKEYNIDLGDPNSSWMLVRTSACRPCSLMEFSRVGKCLGRRHTGSG